jgi:hypothetical protein
MPELLFAFLFWCSPKPGFENGALMAMERISAE